MNPLTWPLWMRCQLGGLLWAGFFYLRIATAPRTVTTAVIYVFGGVVFGLALWALARARQRRLFGDLTHAERKAVVDAIEAARPPDDARLREAAVRMARHCNTPRTRARYQLIFFGLFVVLSVYVAIAETWWGAFGVVIFPLAAWYSIRTEARQRDTAQRFLHAAQALAAP